MKDLKYYVLGKKENKMLKAYQEKYFHLLQKKIFDIKELKIKEAFLVYENEKNILLRSDISSRIEYFSLVGLGETPFQNHNEIIKKCLHDLQNIDDDTHKKIEGTQIYLTIHDQNPYSQLEAHPDHIKNNVGMNYGEKGEEYWYGVYAQAFQQLKEIDNGVYEELNFIIQKIIPLGTSYSVHNSASYKESIGQLYMGLFLSKKGKTHEIIPILEALIHESSHNKLNLINKFDRLLLNDYELSYYSPYRPDARHIWGVFIGVHAFSATIYYLLKYYQEKNLNDIHLLEKLLNYNIKNSLGLKILKKYGRFTIIGKEILDEIEYTLVLSSNILRGIKIQSELLQRSKKQVIEHFTEVKNTYTFLKY